MACEPGRSEQIADFAAGRIEGAAVTELLEHLAACPPCSEEFDLVADLTHLGRPLAAGSPAAGPTHAIPDRARGVRRRAWLGPLLAGAAATLLLVVFLQHSRTSSLGALADLEALPYPASVLRGTQQPGESGDSADAARRSAMDHYRNGQFEQAATALEALARRDPSDALAHFYRGVSLLQLGRSAEARQPLRSAADAGAGLLRERALWYLTSAELASGEAQRARAVLERLIEIDGEYVHDAQAKLDALRPFLGQPPERER